MLCFGPQFKHRQYLMMHPPFLSLRPSPLCLQCSQFRATQGKQQALKTEILPSPLRCSSFVVAGSQSPRVDGQDATLLFAEMATFRSEEMVPIRKNRLDSKPVWSSGGKRRSRLSYLSLWKQGCCDQSVVVRSFFPPPVDTCGATASRPSTGRIPWKGRSSDPPFYYCSRLRCRLPAPGRNGFFSVVFFCQHRCAHSAAWTEIRDLPSRGRIDL